MKTSRLVSSLLGLILCTALARAQGFAPSTLANLVLNGSISSGTLPFASTGTATEAFSASGNFYVLSTSGTVVSSAGTYVYTQTGPNSGMAQQTFTNSDLPVTTYSFVFTNQIGGTFAGTVGGVTVQTGVFALSPFSFAAPIVNISSRAFVGKGGSFLIAGFVVGGTTPQTVLIRASGPALTGLGVAGALPDPELQLYSGTTVINSNTGWAGNAAIASTAISVGAFAWSASSADSALLVTLAPGPYTAIVSGASGDTGVALAEVYYVQ